MAASSSRIAVRRALVMAAVVAALSVEAASAQSPPAEMGPVKAEQFYKNVQVFKGLPAEQVMPAMYFISSALGVDCGFCHNEDRTIDTPMKAIARRMIQMTASINNNAFNGGVSVSCHTCHRGSAHPPSSLPADDTAHFPRVTTIASHGSQVEPMPSPAELIQRYVAALGGTAALAKHSTMAATGTATDIDGRAFPLEVLSRPSGRLVLRSRPKDPIPVTYTGKTGWLVDYANHLREMRLDEVEAAALEDGVWVPARLVDLLVESTVDGIEQIDGADVYVVSGRTPYLPQVRVSFDKTSGLLRRLEYFTDAGVGRFPVQLDVEKHTVVDGARVPSRWVVTEIRRRRWTYQLDAFTPGAAIPDSRFLMPVTHEH
jgi:hypothetical protein